jgi:outer membrane protein TolC
VTIQNTQFKKKNGFLIKRLGILFSFALALNMPCWAAKPKPKTMVLSLKEAILLSLRYNPTVKSSELQRVVDKFSLAVAKNQFELQYALTGAAVQTNSIANNQPLVVSGNYSLVPVTSLQTVYGTNYSLQMNNPVTLLKSSPTSPTLNFYNPSLTLNITQPLLRGSGREVVQAPLNVAYNVNAIAALNFKSNIINTVTQIMQDYWNVVAADGALKVAQTALEVSIKTVANNALQIKEGFMASSENVQAEAAVANQRILVASSENQVLQAKINLLRDIGLSPFTSVNVDDGFHFENFKYPVGEEARRIMMANNPQINIARLSLRNAKISLLLAEDQQRWSLNFVTSIVQGGGSGGGKNANFSSLFNGWNRSRTLGLTLSVPIDNLPVQQQYVNAKVGLSQEELNARLLRLSLESQLLSQIENLRILLLQVKLAKQSVTLSYKSYQDALVKVKYGQASMFEVTTLQTNYINASLQVISAEIAYVTSIAQYYQLLGITLDKWSIKLHY